MCYFALIGAFYIVYCIVFLGLCNSVVLDFLSFVYYCVAFRWWLVGFTFSFESAFVKALRCAVVVWLDCCILFVWLRIAYMDMILLICMFVALVCGLSRCFVFWWVYCLFCLCLKRFVFSFKLFAGVGCVNYIVSCLLVLAGCVLFDCFVWFLCVAFVNCLLYILLLLVYWLGFWLLCIVIVLIIECLIVG